ncbi:hypothetical protein [Acetobacter sp.]|jgi:hypothetical protein|uniref:hypothetical protein n=1 Tax=Acetobacter sp. TaxID=440 RepID=UPI0025BF0AB4|nr:hypothetical protein [Acetobacter sp.]MCH4091555.1 hypothetical protein [Acetobacter sp.]MCI1299533.1 hypothetical protein [Acetobacter sp.]MCI1316877.1 hypothetical protein [Acetobacter sp.]
MDIDKIQKKVASGFNKAANIAGFSVIQIRPQNSSMPTSSDKISILRCLIDPSPSFSGLSPIIWGHKILFCAIDTENVKIGDYLEVQEDLNICNISIDIYFVARFEPWKPLLIVQTNKSISFYESDVSSDNNLVGLRPPSGPVWKNDIQIASNYRVSMLEISASGRSPTGLGTDLSVGNWEILMPRIPDVTLSQGLRIKDMDQNCYHILTVEETQFGLRLIVKSDQA